MNRFFSPSVVTLSLLGLLGCAGLGQVAGPETHGVPSVPGVSGLEVRDHRNAKALRFAVLGDIGTGGFHQAAVGRAMYDACSDRGSCDFVLVTGDNIYHRGTAPLRDPAEERTRRMYERAFETPYRIFGRTDFWLVAGNHDWYQKKMPANQIAYSSLSERWRMPALDYSVPQLPEWITIYGIDTTLLGKGVETGQVSRAREQLCGTFGWRILFGHHPVYTASHCGGGDGTLEKIERVLLGPLIRKCGVDVFLAGHDHLQAHFETPDFHQIVQGAGGAHLYDLRDEMRFPARARVEVAEAKSAFGFAIIEAAPKTLSIIFYEMNGDLAEAFYERELDIADRPIAPTRLVM